MSVNIVPIEQYLAQLATGLDVSLGQGGDPQKILPRAQTALTVGNDLAKVADGNLSGALAAITASMQNTSMDPAVAASIQGLLTIGFAQAQIAQNVANLTPVFGATGEAIIGNVSKGVITAANLEIAKYGSSQPAKA